MIHCQNTKAIQTIDSPTIKDDAPETIEIKEDSDYYYFSKYSIYEESNEPFTLKIWDGINWDETFDNNNLTLKLLDNESIELKPKENISGNDKIIFNATNTYGSTHHNLTIKITPINDPPTSIIITPINESQLYSKEKYHFEGIGFDPDTPIGDKLTFIWASDIDGILGYGRKLEVYNLTVGTHQISFSVIDLSEEMNITKITIFVKQGPFDTNLNINLSSNYNSIIIKQDDKETIDVKITNDGKNEENVTFEIDKGFYFNGNIKSVENNVVIKPNESIRINFVIIIPKETDIGVYPIDIRGITETSKDNIIDNYTEYRNIISFLVIVISNNSLDQIGQANKPDWKVGNKWEYSIKVYDILFENIMEGTFSDEIVENTTLNVNNKNHNVFKINMNYKIEFDKEPAFRPLTNIKLIDMTGSSYFITSNLASIKYERISNNVYDSDFGEFTVKSEWEGTFNPYNYLDDWPINSGEVWTVEYSTSEVSKEYLWEDYYETYYDSWVTIENYVCLGVQELTIGSETFEGYPIMKIPGTFKYKYGQIQDLNNNNKGSRALSFGVSNSFDVFYYSPDVGWDLKQITYQKVENKNSKTWFEIYDWKESIIVELKSFFYETKDIDEDQDNIPDYWEKKYDINETNEDYDNDGFSNLEEFLNGTNPINNNDLPIKPIDNDMDGMPDTWEQYHSLDPSNSKDYTYDPDSDGFTNIEEYEYNTLPRDANDYPLNIEPPYNKTSNSNHTDESIFGLGKIVNIDLFYIYLLIIIVIILVLISIFVRHKKNLKEKQFQNNNNNLELRVISSPDTKSSISTFTQKSIFNPHQTHGKEITRDSSYQQRITPNYSLQQHQGQSIIQPQQHQVVQLKQYQQYQQYQQYICTTCGQQKTYIPQNNRYYCHQCKKYE
jgi:hypothetical protein